MRSTITPVHLNPFDFTLQLVFCRVSSPAQDIDDRIYNQSFLHHGDLYNFGRVLRQGFLNNIIAPHLEEFSLPNTIRHYLFSQKIFLFIAFFLYDLPHLPSILWTFYESRINAFTELVIIKFDIEYFGEYDPCKHTWKLEGQIPHCRAQARCISGDALRPQIPNCKISYKPRKIKSRVYALIVDKILLISLVGFRPSILCSWSYGNITNF